MTRLAELRTLLAKATPGPWARANFVEQTGDFSIATLCENDDAPAFPVESIMREDDAAAIVAMRNSYEALLDVADAAQGVLSSGETEDFHALGDAMNALIAVPMLIVRGE